jgi:hypothetical protein
MRPITWLLGAAALLLALDAVRSRRARRPGAGPPRPDEAEDLLARLERARAVRAAPAPFSRN